MRRSVIWAAALAVASCATLSKEDCLQGAWSRIGFEDGQNGRPPERVTSHAEACQKYGVTPDYAVWRQGYANGLVLYCTRPSGFEEGVRGSEYHGVCTGNAEGVFLLAYGDGRRVHDVRAEIDSAESDRSRLEDEIDHAREKRDGAREQADSPDIADEQRKALLDRAGELDDRVKRLRRELHDAERRIDDARDDARRIEARMRVSYPEWNGD